jgi:hypothetical protein
MAARGAKPFFSFLTFAFLMAALVAGAQAAVQWQHPDALGWPDQIAAVQAGGWGTAVALGLGALLGLICLVLGAYSLMQRRRAIGVTAVLFAAALGAAPHLASPWTIYVASGSLLLFFLLLKVTDVLDKRASMPKTAAPSKKAG